MATSSFVKSVHATLVAATVDTRNILQYWDGVEISNRGTVPIYVSWNGAVPTVAGADTDIVEAGVTKQFSPAPKRVGPTSGNNYGNPGVVDGTTPAHIVKLISSGTPAYSVVGIAGK